MSILRSAPLVVAAAFLWACGSNETGYDSSPDTPPQGRRLTLSGTVPDVAGLDGALVTVLVGDVASQTSVAGGAYSVVLDDVADDAFVSIAVRGSGAYSDIELQSLVGTVGGLAAAAGADDTATVAEVPALALNSLNTAAAAYVREPGGVKAKAANPQSPVQSDAALALAYAELDTVAQLGLAVAIEQVMRDRVALPQGIATTFVLARSAGAREAFVRQQTETDTDAFRDRATDLASGAQWSVPLPADLYFVNTLYYADRFQLSADGTGQVLGVPSFYVSDAAAHWRIEDGTLVVEMDQPRGVAVYRDLDGDGDPFEDEELVSAEELIVYEIRVLPEAIAHGPGRSVLLDRTTLRRFTGAALADEIDRKIYLGDLVDAGALPATSSALVAGRTLAMEVPSIARGFLEGRADVVSFESSGTGTLASSGTSFSWRIDNGALELDLGEGLIATYRRLGSFDATADRYVVAYRQNATDATAQSSLYSTSLVVDASEPPVIGDVQGRYRRDGGFTASYLGLIAETEWLLRADSTAQFRQTSNFGYAPSGRLLASGPATTVDLDAQWHAGPDGKLRIYRTRDDASGETGCAPELAGCQIVELTVFDFVNADEERHYGIETLYFGDESTAPAYSTIRRFDRAPLAE